MPEGERLPEDPIKIIQIIMSLESKDRFAVQWMLIYNNNNNLKQKLWKSVFYLCLVW